MVKSTELYGKLHAALDEIGEWFRDRYDADCQDGQWVPNEEMKMGEVVWEAKDLLTKFSQATLNEQLETVERALKSLTEPVA